MTTNAELGSKVVTALRWTMSARLLGQIFTWASTLFVIRILSPEDYGLMAMAMVLIGLLTLIDTLGTDVVLVQKPDLSEHTRSQIFGLNILVRVFYFCALLLTADFVAAFWGEDIIADILRVLSVLYLITIFETMPLGSLQRAINMKSLSVAELLSAVTGSAAVLVMALSGFGVWSLVYGTIITRTLNVIGLNVIAREQPKPSFNFRGMSKDLKYSAFISADRVVDFVFMESDKFIGGKMLGAQGLGYYSVASHIASLPIQKLTGLLKSLALQAFSRANENEAESVAPYAYKAIRLMGLVAFPVFWGISAVTPELVQVVLGQKWAPAAPLLQVLTLIFPLRMVGNIIPPMLWGVGKPDVSATNYLIAAIIMGAALYVGATFGGALGLCFAWLLAYPIVFMITVVRASAVVDLALSGIVRVMIGPFLGVIVMFAAVSLMRPLAYAGLGDVVVLVQLVGVGVLSYGAFVVLFQRDQLAELIRLVRK